MDSDSKLDRFGHTSKYDMEEPTFQRKRKMSGSPSRRAKEPNLPIRKKVTRDYESRGHDNDDFFILGDQSKFRLDMVPYRARSLSSHRYADSTDMLSWPENDNNDRHHQHQSRTRHRHDNGELAINDSHYHRCTDEATNQDQLPVQSQQQLQSTANRNYQQINGTNNDVSFGTKVRQQNHKKSIKTTSINDDNPPLKHTNTNIQTPNNNTNVNNKKATTATTRIVTNRTTANKRHVNQRERNTDEDGGKELQTKSDVGKFLNEKHEERMREERMNHSSKKTFDGPKGTSRKESESKISREIENSKESLGEVIANKSNQNKENTNEAVQNGHGSHHSPLHHLRHRSLSEYQDKFQWLPLNEASANFNRSQSHLTWLTTPAIISNSEYANQFRPNSAIPLRDHHRHRDLFKKEQYGEDKNISGRGLAIEQRKGNEDAQTNDNKNNITTDDLSVHELSHHQEYPSSSSEHYHKNSRHYKSEYTIKFIPPSDYLLVDDIWVKADHVRKILGERNITQPSGKASRWAEHKNGERDRSLTVADLRRDLVPSSGAGRHDTSGGNVRPKTVSYHKDTSVNSDDDNLRSSNNNKDGINFHGNNNNKGEDLHNGSNREAVDARPPKRPQSTSLPQPIHLGDSWFDYILELRKRANLYRSRGYGMNFSRDHLAQIRSDNLFYWDDSNSESAVSPDEDEVARVEELERSKGYPATRPILSHSNGTSRHHFGVGVNNINTRNIPGHNHSNTPNRNYPSFPTVNDSNHSKGRAVKDRSGGRNNNNVESFSADLHRNSKNDGVGSCRPGNFAVNNPIGRDSDELSESLSSSLSLAEEVLERAKMRKHRLWTTQ